MKKFMSLSLGSGVLIVLLSAMANAAPGGPPRHERMDDRRHDHAPYEYRDARYNHNHYYPTRGHVVTTLPRERVVVTDRRGHRYFHYDGVWYAPRGPRFVVVAPPIGVFLPVLPHFYTTVWIGGFPYYYANGTYYLWRDRERAYEVVDPPDDRAAQVEPPENDEVFVYPKNGQSPEQQSRDRYECHRWASSETGFDPTQAGGGVPDDQTSAKRADYHRALTACLEGRGYSVK